MTSGCYQNLMSKLDAPILYLPTKAAFIIIKEILKIGRVVLLHQSTKNNHQQEIAILV